MTVAPHYLSISGIKLFYYLNECFAVTLKNLQAAMVFQVLSVPMSKMSFLSSFSIQISLIITHMK